MSAGNVESQRIFNLCCLGLLVIECAIAIIVDAVGWMQLSFYGPYVLYGLMVPGNLFGLLISLGFVIRCRTDSYLLWAALIAFVFNLVSSGFVGLLVMGHWMFMNFPGPG